MFNSWISVNDKLPAKDQRVIATDGHFTGEAMLDREGRWCRHYKVAWFAPLDDDVTHWMPMPSPPDGDEYPITWTKEN